MGAAASSVESLHVNFETTLFREGLETGSATKGFFSRVNLHVAIEFGFFGKGLDALRAAEGSLSRVDAFVGC